MMNHRARATGFLHPVKSSIKHDQEMDAHKPTKNRRISSKEKKLALIQDVDRLKKKLRHEENVHRALKRAFTRPLGTLPRLPPYLPPYTLELLAEVAVLEEEVVRLEEQIVLFRKRLEAVSTSSSVKNVEYSSESYDCCVMETMKKDEPTLVVQTETNIVTCPSKPETEKENQSCVSSVKNKQQSPSQKSQTVKNPTKRLPIEKKTPEKRSDTPKSRLHCRTNSSDNAEAKCSLLQEERRSGDDSPNAISENMLKCLFSIFSRMSMEKLLPVGALSSDPQDPYEVYSEFEKRDIGPYKNLCSIDARSINLNRTSNCLFLIRRLKILIAKLASVKLQKLTHQEKLAFWINIYNSCMMNAFLEHGIETTNALMQKFLLPRPL